MSPDSKLMASATSVVVDSRGGKNVVGEVKLWNAQTGELARTLTVENDNVVSLAFSADGNLLAAGGGNMELPHRPIRITVWDVRSGRVTRTLDGYDEDVTNVAFIGDGAGLVVVGYTRPPSGKVLRMWETSGNDVGWMLKWPNTARHSFARSTTGDLLMVVNTYIDGPWDRDIQTPGQAAIALWNLREKTQLAMRAGGYMAFTEVSVSLNGRVAAGANALGVEAWGIPTGVHFTRRLSDRAFGHIALSECAPRWPSPSTSAGGASGPRRSRVPWDMTSKTLIGKAFGEPMSQNSYTR